MVTSDCASRMSSPAARAIRSARSPPSLSPAASAMRAHFLGHRLEVGRIEHRHQRIGARLEQLGGARLVGAPTSRRSAPGTRLRPRPRRSPRGSTLTASCASSPAARTRMWRVPPNSEVERASSPSRTGSERSSAPDSSTRSPGSGSIAASLSAAAAAPASSGPQKKNDPGLQRGARGDGGEIALGRLHDCGAGRLRASSA